MAPRTRQEILLLIGVFPHSEVRNQIFTSRPLKNSIGVLRDAQGFDIIVDFPFMLSLSKHEDLEAFRAFLQQPASVMFL
jgi:hypothetical protein